MIEYIMDNMIDGYIFILKLCKQLPKYNKLIYLQTIFNNYCRVVGLYISFQYLPHIFIRV